MLLHILNFAFPHSSPSDVKLYLWLPKLNTHYLFNTYSVPFKNCDKIHLTQIYHFSHCLNVQLSSGKYIHIVVQQDQYTLSSMAINRTR